MKRNALILIALILIWELCSLVGFIPSLFGTITSTVPSFSLFAGKSNTFLNGVSVLAFHTGISLIRIIVGVSIGLLLGVSTGLLIHYFRKGSGINKTILSSLRAIPLMALIPLFIYWFGNREIGIYTYIAFGVFVIMATITYEAVGKTSPIYVQQAKLLGANWRKQYFTVFPKAIIPNLLPAVRDSLGMAWAFTLGAEYISASSGLGYLAYQSYLYADQNKLLILGLTYMILGYAGYSILKILESKRDQRLR